MSFTRIYILLGPLLLCACQGGYRNYLPAPHEMSTTAIFAKDKKYVSEEQISVQESQPMAPDVLQALMKARGYIYIGQRTIRSEYSLSISGIRKAAYEIGASQAIYFAMHKDKVREKRSKIEIGNFVSEMIGAKNAEDRKRAGQNVVKTRDYIEDVTYYTYNITYWTKDINGQATILTKNETLLLKGEQKKLKKEVQQLKKKIATLEKRKLYINNTNNYINKTTVINHSDEISDELNSLKQELQATTGQIKEYQDALAQNSERQQSMPYRKGSNPISEDYDIYKNRH